MTHGYWLFLIAIIPIAAAVYFWVKFKTINWWESLLSVLIPVGVASLTILGVQGCQQQDYETWSGYAQKAVHTPYWVAEWEEWVDDYDSEGKVSGGHWETRTETHHPDWWLETTIGKIDIGEKTWNNIVSKHGVYKERGYRPDFDHGDRYDYFSDIKNTEEDFPDIPVSKQVSWRNPFKNTNSIIPKETAKNIKTFLYPNGGALNSGRAINSNISQLDWDRMNARIGASKKVNVIICYCDDNDISYAQAMESKWMGGKKNDLVICYGGEDETSAKWSYVFGWSKTSLVKYNLQTILLENKIDSSIIPLVEAEIKENFVPYDWANADGGEVIIPVWSIVMAFILCVGAQVGLFYWFHNNDINKY